MGAEEVLRSGGAVLIAGPTASGKSALALALAERLGGVVVNADSMQVYRELRLITARPTPADEARAPHLLYGHRPAAQGYSVAGWLDDVAAALAEARREGRPAVVVGGTGLYFRALTEGLAETPRVPGEVRQAWRERGRAGDGPALHRELAKADPVMAARLRPSDPQRILRALEVFHATGRSLAEWQAGPPSPPLVGPGTPRVVLDPPRAELHRRIEARARGMLEAGALDEVRAILSLGLDPELPAMKALGLPELGALLRGEAGPERALAALQASTRRFAKRQSTWFRNQMPDWPRLLDSHEAGAMKLLFP